MGMTFIELIVVLSIFSAMTSVVLFNYGEFQAKVDIKNLASDIALKVVEAQKSSLSGKLPTQSFGANWKPSYGVYFNLSSPGNNKTFIYFTDLDQSGDYTDTSFCSSPGGSGECLDKITITKGNSISSLDVFYQGDITPHNLNDLIVTFARPNSGAIIKSSQIVPPLASPISYVQITISSPKAATAKIKLYSSGRIQVN